MSRDVYHGCGATALPATSEREFILPGIDFCIRVFHICPVYKIALFPLSAPNSMAILNDKRYATEIPETFAEETEWIVTEGKK